MKIKTVLCQVEDEKGPRQKFVPIEYFLKKTDKGETLNLLQAWYYAIGKGVQRPAKIVNKENDRMRIYLDGNNFIAAFDPTNDIFTLDGLKDWVSNLKFLTDKEIEECANRFYPTIESYFKKFPGFNFWFDGYSRGGGLAREMSFRIADKFKRALETKERVIHCRAFEPPAVMNKKKATYYNSKLPIEEIWTRNGRDPVTYMAPNMHHTGWRLRFKQPYKMLLPWRRIETHLETSVEKAIRKKLK